MLIPIAPFPQPSVSHTIPPAAYSAWSSVVSLHLQLVPTKFTSQSLTDEALCTFLLSYLRNQPNIPPDEESGEQKALRRKVISLVHRIATLPEEYASLPAEFVSGRFLRDVAAAFPRSRVLRSVFDEERVWRRFEDGVVKLKRMVIAGGGVSQGDKGLEGLFRFSRRAAEIFLAGDDWLDAVVEKGIVGEFKVALLEVSGAGTVGVEGARKGNWSMVTDNIYGLINASKNPKANGIAKEKGFLKTLIESTTLISALRKCARGTAEEGKVEGMLKTLEKFGRPRAPRRKVVGKEKGKGKEIMIGLSEEEEMEMMSKVAMIRDLFPNLGSGFVRKCLDALEGDVERVTGALLENDLPGGLKNADQSEEYIPPDTSLPTPTPSSKAPPTTTPSTIPTRRNVFDNDDLSHLSPAALSRVHLGRKNASLTADTLLTHDRVSKSSILSALAAFDSDDDERDDTYDLADVGGAVDTAGPPGDEDQQRRVAPRTVAGAGTGGDEEESKDDVAEKILYETYKAGTEVFSRHAETRRSASRKSLKEKTGWSDEAIEGWKVMLEREPKRLRMLERRFSDLPGGSGGNVVQNVLERTSWAPTDGGDGDDSGRGRGTGRGRGRGQGGGGGGRGRGGNAAGPSGEKETQQGRARKEASKGSRANHNRRDQRAKKIARGGFPPAG